MAFDTFELQQLNSLFADQHKSIIKETRQLLAEALTEQRKEIRVEMHQQFDNQRQELRGEMQYFFNQQRSGIMLDVRSIMRQEFEPVVERLDRLIVRNEEDIGAAFDDIGKLKKRVTRLEKRQAT